MRIYNPTVSPSDRDFPYIEKVDAMFFVVYDYDDTHGEYIFDVVETEDEAQQLLIQ